VATAKRLLDAFAKAKADEGSARIQRPREDLWTRIVEAKFEQLIEILDSQDASALSNYLLHFGEEFFAFGGLTLTVDGFLRESGSSSVALGYLDKLVCLAEAIGVLPLENPEQPRGWGENLHTDLEELVDRIERAIGIDLLLPAGAVPVTGIATSRGPVHYRHINSLYAALRLRALAKAGGAVCEYGGGLGLVAAYARKLGVPAYTIFDLPLVNVFAGHYLINTLGSEEVQLYGEDGHRPVRVLPYWQCMDQPDRAFSVAINQDSFPEIDPILVSEYLRQIERTTDRYFLSINHESQASMGTRAHTRVPELVRGFESYRRLYRMKYWIREGYIEELYEFRR